MAYRVELTDRALSDLRYIYFTINGADSQLSYKWFNGLKRAVLSLDENPARSAPTPESRNLRHLLYGRRRHCYRIIYAIDDVNYIVTVLHIRHWAQDAFSPGEL